MPIVKRQDGWYWGSKGPFPTRAKAAQVAGAAYASGYKEEALNENAIAEFVGAIMHSATVAHFKHLMVEGPGADAAHRALQAYYEGVPDLIDSVAENIQGAYDIIIAPYPSMFADNTDEPLVYMQNLREYVREARRNIPQDSEIQNEVDAIASLINSSCYRLARLK